MDDGKPTGSKAKWWSRPSAVRMTPSGPERSEPADAQPSAPAPEAGREAAVEAPAPTTAAPPQPVEPPPSDTVVAPQSAEPVTADTAVAPAPAVEPVTAETAFVPAPSVADTVVAPAMPVATAPSRPTPLHEPDPYSTPPYGGPGPWAPAPPVQRPVPTPAQGTPVPPQYTAPQTVPHPAQPAPHAAPSAPLPPAQHEPAAPHAQQQMHHHPRPAADERPQPLNSVWLQYDPWSAPGRPLTEPGEPVAKKRRRGPLLIGALVIALVAGGAGGAIGAYVERNGGIAQVELPQADRESGDRAPDSVAGIAASALPSVVTLHVSGGGEQGTGTGFVLDRQGHILTNNHVVDPAGASGDITITFSGGETAEATLVGKDSGYDLAVVKVTGVSGLKPLPLGNSDNVRVGDPVVAIGAPFDLQNTVTSGIISAKERPITAGGEKGDGSDVSYVDALQTDAPINPGNSGGPLVDSKARVIGINSAIRAADTGAGAEGGQAGSIGLGFAIPINQGKRVAEELINTGKATHPVIGVSLDMKFTGDGARVGERGKDDTPSITPGGPADKAGIKPGDVITKVDGQRVHSGEELIVKIRAHRPGDRLELTIRRGGEERTMTLTLGSADNS
ncbi:trypsin-like peptidase domain-containing protein [Streptomyces sp. PKU-EA00015]|uniref:S1C family serine protease n=1 Tax=Streptomyces sp. PKU-EA00015 TaxID=2748326 RepID=UPI0015A22A03|nr:trypsin-like peptidase domain-containing protein [Streptomyces sp. PKU-EA00015]NWF28151.1 trypsin-like peptidase domain-containing protein [Streptomyces sp. PKU-EA00015]